VADPADYHARWRRNTALADAVATSLPDGRDWEIVLRFYGALHLVEGFMRTKPDRFWSESHEARGLKLRGELETRRAAGPYRNLLDLSKDVRYDPRFAPTERDFANAKQWASTLESFFKAKLERALPPAAPAAAVAAPSVASAPADPPGAGDPPDS